MKTSKLKCTGKKGPLTQPSVKRLNVLNFLLFTAYLATGRPRAKCFFHSQVRFDLKVVLNKAVDEES